MHALGQTQHRALADFARGLVCDHHGRQVVSAWLLPLAFVCVCVRCIPTQASLLNANGWLSQEAFPRVLPEVIQLSYLDLPQSS